MLEKTVLQQALRRAQRYVPDVSLAVRYWDGSEEAFGQGQPQFRVSFSGPEVVRRALRDDPILALGEGYMDGTVDVEGDLRDVIAFLYRARNAAGDQGNTSYFGLYSGAGEGGRGVLSRLWGALGAGWERLSRWGGGTGSSKMAQAEDVRRHYDLGNGFFSLWLDATMSYSCAYFRDPQDPLEQAQRQKIAHILRKLHLQPGERLLDIGCGWGWLIITAAQQYGVRALGITLSEEQYRGTRERIRELGLEGQVEVALKDYRDLAGEEAAFDKVVSVGMFEHVGRAHHRRYMEVVRRVLKPGGLSLLHTITRTDESPMNPWIVRYIFPGGYVPSFREVAWLLPEYGFQPIDVESLRLHYAMTLDAWAERFEARADEVRRMFDDRFVRMWRLYLRSCAASFRWSGLDVHQFLFSKGLNNGLPLTREYMYG